MHQYQPGAAGNRGCDGCWRAGRGATEHKRVNIPYATRLPLRSAHTRWIWAGPKRVSSDDGRRAVEVGRCGSGAAHMPSSAQGPRRETPFPAGRAGSARWAPCQMGTCAWVAGRESTMLNPAIRANCNAQNRAEPCAAHPPAPLVDAAAPCPRMLGAAAVSTAALGAPPTRPAHAC